MGGSVDVEVMVDPAELQRIQDLYDRGLYVQAYAIAEKIAPLNRWSGPEALVLAGRLAGNIGGHRLHEWLLITAHRRHRDNHEAAYYYTWRKAERRGPLNAWYYLEELNDRFRDPTPTRADALAFQARLASQFRDFDAATELIFQAEEIAPNRSWTQIEKALIVQNNDEYEQALAILEAGRHLEEGYRANVQYSAEVLLMLNRDNEAADLLAEAGAKVESGAIHGQLAGLQTELCRYEEALGSLDRMEALSPLLEKAGRNWLSARRCDLLYHLGRFEEAAGYAGKLDDAFYKKFKERLGNLTGRRVHLPVGFVRQHHDTCVPATLAALGKFWDRPVDHVELADEICYGGTPDHRERNWAEQNGFVAREFKVTWESAQALLDRGIPFTLVTTGPVGGHLQAVIGYDSNRETLLIRDPSLRIHGEVEAAEFLKAFAHSGPRGMAIVPIESRHLLEEGIELPEAELYDCYYNLRRALHRHDRDEAERQYEAAKNISADGRMTLLARRTLAYYDANQVEILAAIEEALKEFPEDGHLLLWKSFALRDLARRDGHLAFLKDLCSRKKQDPVFWRDYAQALSMDSRMEYVAEQYLRSALTRRPADADSLYVLAGVFWSQRKYMEAFRLYRFAACMAETREDFARSYFLAAQYLRQTEQALEFLNQRCARLGGKSSAPVRSLYSALSHLERNPDAFAVLDWALEQCPEDGQLLLFASDAHGRYGHYEVAAQLLERAEPCARRNAWLRQKAAMCGYHCDSAGALDSWKQVLQTEPLAQDANSAVARLLAETEGEAKAVEHLRNACERFPYNVPLHRILIEWLKGNGDDLMEPMLRHLATINPDDAWTRRELAVMLASSGRSEEAFAEADLAVKLEPNSPYSHATRSHVFKEAGMIEEANAEVRHALTLSIDNAYAMNSLIALCDTVEQRKEALDFIRQQLLDQVVFGEGLFAFRGVAYAVMEREELLASLQEALQARPDLWHAWSVVIGQLCDMGRTDDALALALESCERFPLLPGAWGDLAFVHEVRHERKEQIEALHHALQINPQWGIASRKLAKAHEKEGDFAQCRSVLELAVARVPLDWESHGALADILWKTGEKEEAIKRAEHALRLNPDYPLLWDVLSVWTREHGQPDRIVEFARSLAASRGGNARIQLVLARHLRDFQERLDAVDKAISLSPKLVDAHDLKAALLTTAKRFHEAHDACRPECWREKPPMELRGRDAWILAQEGKLNEARPRVREILKDFPGYAWAWSLRADWAAQEGANSEYLEAAQQLVRLEPRSAVAYGYLADAKSKCADARGAKEALVRALQIDPTYAFGARKLLELQTSARDWEGAAASIESIRKHIGPWQALESEVQLAAAGNRDRAGALETLKKLCAAPENQTELLKNAIAMIDKAGWSENVTRTLFEVLQQADRDTNPETGAIWVERWAKAQKWQEHEHLDMLAGRGELGLRAFISYADALGKNSKSLLVRDLLKKHSEWLKVDTRSWGAVGFALSSGPYREAAKWLSDWKGREGVQPWMLANLVNALHCCHQYAEAAEVCQKALELDPDYTTNGHRIWFAYECAIAGDTEQASAELSKASVVNLGANFAFVVDMTRVMVESRNEPPERRKEFLRKKSKEIWNSVRHSEALIPAYERFKESIHAGAGGHGRSSDSKSHGKRVKRAARPSDRKLLSMDVVVALIVVVAIVIFLIFMLGTK